MRDLYDEADRIWTELKDGEAGTPMLRRMHRLETFHRREGNRSPTLPELYAMHLAFSDQLSPADLAEGKRLRDTKALDYTFAVERAWDARWGPE